MRRPFVSPWNRARRNRELDEELRAHLAMAEADRIAGGESAADAAANARRELGDLFLVKEETREAWGGVGMEDLAQDLRFGVRMLRRNPGFSLLAILCLTVGIGANAAVYSWIEGILLRPYPGVAGQDRLLVVAGTVRGAPGASELSWPDYLDLRRSSTLFESFVTDKITGTTLSVGERAERVSGQIVSADYFDAIGVRPILGRGFEPAEETGRNAHPVTVIGYRLWRDRFHGDPGVIGQTQILNGVPHTIVGVAPEGFNGTFVGYAMQFWVPASMQETFDRGGYKLEDRGARWVESFVRLKPGVTREQAQAELSALARRLEARYPETDRGRGIELFRLWSAPFNNAGALLPTLRIGVVVAFLVLLIACANVGNLLLVRSLARRSEMTVRLAIGAGRGRLVRQLVSESLILASLAGAGGMLVAYWCRNLLVLVLPPRGVPMNLPAALDWRVLFASGGLCLLTTLLFGLGPIWSTTRIDLAAALKADTGGVVRGSGRARIHSGLVLLQVSLSFVLLVVTGLLLKSVVGMRAARPGFDPEHLLISAVDLSSAGYDPTRQKTFQDELIDRVRTIGGVESAAFARVPPFSYRTFSSAPIAIPGYAGAPDEQPLADYDEVSPGFLATLGIPLVSGREFTRSDDESAPGVAVVNETMAARYWPHLDPVGRTLELKGRRLEVVGVAATVKYESLTEPAQPFFYVPLRQNPAGAVVLHIRTSQPRGAIAPALAREVRTLAPGLAPAALVTMREQVDSKSGAQTAALWLVGAFGGVALFLAAIGLYGVMSYAVSQSTPELGLRMALGANAADLLRLVMRHGLALTAGGVALGLATALPTTRLLQDLLYEVDTRDPLTFAVALATITIASAASCVLPAWRASRIDPVRALRG